LPSHSAERQDLVHPRLGARAIHLESGHQEDLLAVDLEIHEGIRARNRQA